MGIFILTMTDEDREQFHRDCAQHAKDNARDYALFHAMSRLIQGESYDAAHRSQDEAEGTAGASGAGTDRDASSAGIRHHR
jgi:hypothetical protein